MWPKEVDVDITSWVESLVAGIADVLGDELVGVYLHGSLAMGGYYRPKSDLDLLIVCSTPLGPATREQTARALLTASDRRPTIGDVEASVLQIAHTRRFSHPSPFEMHFSETHSEAIRTGRFDYTIQHTDPDLAAHCTVVRSRGCRLLGEDIGNDLIGKRTGDDPVLDVDHRLLPDVGPPHHRGHGAEALLLDEALDGGDDLHDHFSMKTSMIPPQVRPTSNASSSAIP